MVASTSKIVLEHRRLARELNPAARPVVFTNGCFDILHRGHVAYLEEAAALGNTLLVALNTDDSVRRLGKDTRRPLNPLADRLAVVAALGCVDLVTAFSEDTPLELIRILRPEVLVKGGDWSPDAIVGAADVLAWGGQVVAVPVIYPRSTTRLVERIRHLATV